MKAFVILLLTSLFLGACATVEDTRPLTLDDEPSTSAPKKMIKASTYSFRSSKVEKETGARAIRVESDDLEVANRMTTAMDAFVFKNDRLEFTKLCKDKRFDCLVNDQKFPTGKKTVKRKVPPYMSGSKMGLQPEERVQVRYDFYP